MVIPKNTASIRQMDGSICLIHPRLGYSVTTLNPQSKECRLAVTYKWHPHPNSYLLYKALLFLKAVSFSSCFLSRYHPITKPMGTKMFTHCSRTSVTNLLMVPVEIRRSFCHFLSGGFHTVIFTLEVKRQHVNHWQSHNSYYRSLASCWKYGIVGAFLHAAS